MESSSGLGMKQMSCCVWKRHSSRSQWPVSCALEALIRGYSSGQQRRHVSNAHRTIWLLQFSALPACRRTPYRGSVSTPSAAYPVGTAGAGGRAVGVGNPGTATGSEAFDEAHADDEVATDSRDIGTAKCSSTARARNPGTASGSCKVGIISISLVDGCGGGGMVDIAGQG